MTARVTGTVTQMVTRHQLVGSGTLTTQSQAPYAAPDTKPRYTIGTRIAKSATSAPHA
jgi:hypothetical protein